ncbi:MAG TPA: PocR ligand-binding domain-containing protein [Methanosarcina sp.]|nr:PocR ligand-binding domain-containing protein [Methanosarcina sp.]
MSKDIYKTRVLQKNRKGLLELNWAIPKWMSEKAYLEFDKYNSFLNEFGINLLRLSKQCIRLKLINILSPDRKTVNMELADIIDTKVIGLIMNDIYRLTNVPMCLTDMKGNLLVNVGWQDICTKFHRVHPETYKNCTESNVKLFSGVLPREFKLYRCKNNMLNVVIPINIYCHVGYLYFWQFFFEDEPLDYEFFRSQARKYGFNEQEYIAALEKVPRVSREDLYEGIDFLVMLAKLLNHKRNRACPVSWFILRLKIYFV